MSGYGILYNRSAIDNARLLGHLVIGVKHNHDAGSGETPGVNDDETEGYQRTSQWLNDDGEYFICTDATEGAATWSQVTFAAESPSSP